MNYLITGGCGFIGRNLCEYLDRKDIPYRIVDINPDDNDRDVLKLDVCYRLPLLYGNTIVHLAAETNIRASLERPKDVIIRNCLGILNCLDLLHRDNFSKLIFTSSASSNLSRSPYLASKLACESICKSYSESFGLDINILRLSSVYGPHSIHKQSVVATFIKSCIDRLPLKIFGNGEQKRDFVFVHDVVRSIVEEDKGFISTGTLTSINCLAEMVSDISNMVLNYKPRIVYEQPVQGEVVNPELHCDLDATTDLYRGLLTTFNWFVEHYETK